MAMFFPDYQGNSTRIAEGQGNCRIVFRFTFFFIHKMYNTGLPKFAIEPGVTAMCTFFAKMRGMFLAGKRCLPFIMIFTPRHKPLCWYRYI